MKIRNKRQLILNEELLNLLTLLRKERNFQPEIYLDAKTQYIIEYLKENNINTIIIGISGGIDSALSLAIMKNVSNVFPIKIVPVLIPNLSSNGVSFQKEATKDGEEIIKHFSLSPNIIKLDNITNSIIDEFNKLKFDKQIDEWSIGQSIAYLRTTILYSLTSITTFNQNKAVVIGTTNKDEGSYIGYFGKASDGLVDIQIISDLHKSEVYTLAKHMNIPNKFIERIPTGDLYDKKTDEEIFGFSYDFLELYLLLEDHVWKNNFYLSKESQEIYEMLKQNIENMHEYNSHKYLIGSPAIHLDVLDANKLNGWNNKKHYIFNDDIDCSRKPFNNQQEINFRLEKGFKDLTKVEKDFYFTINNFLNENELTFFDEVIKNKQFIPVGIDGYKENYVENNTIGSYRLSFYSEQLAQDIFHRIKSCLNSIYKFDNKSTDSGNSFFWRPIGINPLFRMIKYEKNGYLIPHYDFPYSFDKNKRTLLTLVIYLNDSNDGGETRFLTDKNSNIDLKERCLDDQLNWSGDIIGTVKPKKGKILVFPHRMLHDSNIYIGNENKTIIRTDIVFERIF